MALRDEPYGGQWGLIDTLGHETIPCRYYYLDTPGEGLAAFRLEQFGNYGYVDVKGNVAIFAPFLRGAALLGRGGRGELQQCQFRACRPQRR